MIISEVSKIFKQFLAVFMFLLSARVCTAILIQENPKLVYLLAW